MEMPICEGTNQKCKMCNTTCSTMKALNSVSPVEIRLFNHNTSDVVYKRLTYIEYIEIQKVLN